ncbi:SRPBCC domain-containing protein [Asticcacaulis sp. 201]|uniref:SRPBCC domain-containing protein n=1 Tax=Asticcacaulis sp. 201 TaxID=3028787 RepID=UPI0029160870|nr:SRPBCC domain-containing protein [Asticcacaulis sp. 201]MDV6331577.1 SRPBCC domain-containing protein [Asticcacaulis sp. 201]
MTGIPTHDATTKGFQVVNTRRLPFTQHQVFQAFADPDQLMIWWGPDGFTNRFQTFDLRIGGQWLFTMVNDTGKTFDNVKEFLEIEAPEKIVFRHLQPMHDFVMTVLTTAAGPHCDLTWIMDFVPGSDEDLKPFLHNANEQNFDRLEAHLTNTL